MEEKIVFVPLRETDVEILHDWMSSDFVRSSFSTGDCSTTALRHRYLPVIEGRTSLTCFIITINGEPSGFIQSFPFFEFNPQGSLEIDHPERVLGFDLFLARADLAGRGVGSKVLRHYLKEYVFGACGADACVANPKPTNVAAVKTYHKIGFEPVPSGEYPNLRILWKDRFNVLVSRS